MSEAPVKPRNRAALLVYSIVIIGVFIAGMLTGYLVRGATLDEEDDRRFDGARRMAERLQRITAESDPGRNPFMNTGRVGILEREATGQEREGREAPLPLLMELSAQLLNSGRTDDAITLLDRIEGLLTDRHVDPRSRLWTEVRLRQAIANLRRAEDDNCVRHHNPRSCLFPVRDAGVHGEKRGSRAAAAILESVLAAHPDHREARWLLNVAYMTLGEYPQGLLARWLLPPELFESDHDIGRFPDIAATVGLDVDDLAGGSIVDDFDGDGYLDVMASSMGLQSQIRYFRSNADGTFAERTGEAGLTGLVGGLNIMQTDYDNDGRLDVLVLRGAWMGPAGRYPKSLLRNNGDGTFSDVTEEAGLLGYHPSQAAVWRDFDGDGWLDLFVGNESSDGEKNACELYRNNGDGTFTECAAEAGVALTEFVKGVAGGDFDNDGRPDLYVSVRGGPNHLFRNVGAIAAVPAVGPGAVSRPARASGLSWAGRFSDVAAGAGVTEPMSSFPTWFFDYDNDGWEDIFVSGYLLSDPGDIASDYLGLPHGAERPRLYRNRGDGTFENATRAAHLDRLLLAMGANYGDLDNDGWLDFYLGTGDPDLGRLLPNRAFRNARGRFFQDVTTSGGFGHLQKGHGVSFADLDNDGDQDIYHVVGGAYEADHFRNALFENPGHGGHWIALRLEGVRSNRAAIGARIKVIARVAGGERAIHKTVSSGGSFGSSPLRQEIGLGDASAIERVEILWPSGGPSQILSGPAMDRHYLVREGVTGVTPIPLRRFRLGGSRAD